MEEILDAALADARELQVGGCDGVIVENMHDLPYLKGRVEPETTAAMALITAAIGREINLPVGVQILAGANREALGVALSAGAAFIRAEAFAYAHVADEGWLDACAGPLLRARSALGAQDRIAIFADVKKKHAAHALTADLSLAEVARGHAFCGADALIVTGISTGQSTNPDDVRAAKEAGLPVFVGSGITPENAGTLAALADGLIVGTALKRDGVWQNPVEAQRVQQIRDAMK
jgi:membrane complex biogenesis BtpA family protein